MKIGRNGLKLTTSSTVFMFYAQLHQAVKQHESILRTKETYGTGAACLKDT